ncbi:hypothetical protein XENOCAPTIV_012510, partial [Xenoophorus captivus]
EQEETLLKQQVLNADNPDLSSLTLKDPPSPVEEVVTNTISAKPVLQYSSAFDDEVAEPTKDSDAELPGTPDPILESVLEEPPEAISEPQPEEDTPPNQADSARPSATVVHGPYYYFYQGVTFSFPTCSDQQYACREMIIFVIAPVICGPQNGNE